MLPSRAPAHSPFSRQVVWCLRAKNKKRSKARGQSCRKLAKRLLKEPGNRNSFCLWQQYAHLEWLLGNTDDARKVFEAALGAAGGRALQDSGLCELGLLYAELELELELELPPESRGAAAARAVHILTRLTESEPGTPAPSQASVVPVLKARKAYEHILEACLQEEGCSSPPAPHAPGRLASVAKCFMLFQYLTVGIEAAVRLHDQVSAKLRAPAGASLEDRACPSPPGPVLEALTLMHTSLLRFHMRISVYPLGPLRQALSEALTLFPDNQGLWRAYVQVQNKSHSASKTRRFFDALTRSTRCLEPWLFAIEAEKMRKRLVETVQRYAPQPRGCSPRPLPCPAREMGQECQAVWEGAQVGQGQTHSAVTACGGHVSPLLHEAHGVRVSLWAGEMGGSDRVGVPLL